MIENPDIGFIHEGQTVRVKLAAFPFQKYGMVDGVVKTVSADAQQQEDQRAADPIAQPFAFKAIIALDKQKLGSVENSLMPAAGCRHVGERGDHSRPTHLFEYLLSPVQRVVSEAGRER